MDDNVEIIRSNKGGMKIIHRGYMYTVHKKRQSGGIRWRCTQRSLHCKGSVSTGDGPTRVNMPHNHIPDPHSVALARCRQFEELADFTSFVETECDDVTDSMSLQQRLQPNTPQIQIPMVSESLLQSQPLSPTKLKVTRQQQNKHASQPNPPKPPEVAPDPVPEEVCLRWNSHHFNMQTSFPNLLQKEQYVDVTLAAEGKILKCHKLILSSCSTYFEEILNGITPLQHPVIFMKDIPFWILKSLCDFMYAGEVHIDQSKLEDMLHVAEALKIKGLAGKTNPPPSQEEQSSMPPEKVNKPQSKQVASSVKQQATPRISAQASSGIEVTPLDPLDLLQASYQEETSNSSRIKDSKVLVKKSSSKKVKKRRNSDHEMSPPPVFHLRKGTRSRPNVKIPKYYHNDYDEVVNKHVDSPSASVSEQLFPVENIKAEPIDVVENDVVYSNDIEPNSFSENIRNPLEYENTPHLIGGNQIIITPIEGIIQNNVSDEKPDNFVKITLSSKYLKEHAEKRVKEETVENESNERNEGSGSSMDMDKKLKQELLDESAKEPPDGIQKENENRKEEHESQPKRRGRKRKFKGRRALSKTGSGGKVAASDINSSLEEIDEISASLKRLESTEGLEVTAERIDTFVSDEASQDTTETVEDRSETAETIEDRSEAIKTIDARNETVEDGNETVEDGNETVEDGNERVEGGNETVEDRNESAEDINGVVEDSGEAVADRSETVENISETVEDKSEMWETVANVATTDTSLGDDSENADVNANADVGLSPNDLDNIDDVSKTSGDDKDVNLSVSSGCT